MSIQPLTFTGVSTLSDSLQQVLTRAVSIAKIPLQQLQNADADVLQKKTLLSGLGDAAKSLADAVESLANIAGAKALGASSSNTAKVTVVNAGAAAASTYTVSEIETLATYASETSIAGYEDPESTPVTTSKSLELTYGSQTRTLTLTSNTLTELRDQINGLQLGVTATILSTGTGSYLSVTSTSLGATTLTLKEGAADILTATNQGTDARFKLNGVQVVKNSNTISDVVPGLSFTLQGVTVDQNHVDTGEKISLSLTTDRSKISAAINQMVASYNGLLDKVNGQVGEAAGLLSGDSAVRDAQENMRALAGYSASGTIKSLAEIGVVFDSAGKMSFDTSTFSSLSDQQISGAITFFGSPNAGFGALYEKLAVLTDPVTGTIKLEQDAFSRTDKNLQTQISILEERINNLQIATAQRLQAADAVLARLESQQRMLDASIQSVNLTIYGKNKD